MAIKVLRIKMTEKTNKQNNNKFPTFKVKTIDGSYQKLKFRKDVEGLPKKPGYYDMEIDMSQINRSQDDYGTVYWVQGNVTFYEPEFESCEDDF